MNLDPNLGSMDRGLRILVGLVLFIFGMTGFVGALDWLAILVGGYLMLTVVFTFCPFYLMLKMSTAPKD